MKVVIGVLLVIHGAITMAQSAGSFNPASPGVPNPAWLSWWSVPLGKSWLLSPLGRSRAAAIEPVLGIVWLIAGVAIVAAGLGLLGLLVPVEYWRFLACLGAGLSLVTIIVYAHPFYAVGASTNAAILVALLWAQWPSTQMFGS